MIRKKNGEGFYRTLALSKFAEGKIYQLKIKGKKLIAFKKNNNFYVLQNRCPHKNNGLENAFFENNCLVCNHHNWKFDIDSGIARISRKYKLIKIPFKIYKNFLWVKTTS